MKLDDIYKNKICPIRTQAYFCEGKRCAKFASCMINEVDALYAIGGINDEEADKLDWEIVTMVRNESLL